MSGDLTARRAALTDQAAQLQFDLGGLAYEMAIRDHFRLDVLVRRAAALQALEAALGEIARLRALQQSATAGDCPACGALHGRDAVFCWQCGHPLVAQAPVNGGAGGAGRAPTELPPNAA
jgi:hypothetical protein